MDQAMQSEEYRGKQVQDLLNELFDEDDSDSDSDEDEDVLSNPDSLLESADSENIKSLLSQSASAPPTVHIHKHISYMVQEELKQAIPQFYVTGAEETFLAIRKQKEEEWETHSEEDQAHLRKVLDQLEDDIKSQQEMAALLREDLEEVQKIEDSDMPEIDEEMQKRYDDMIKQQMEEKLSQKIQAEDVQRKWLLEEDDVEVKRAFIFGLLFGFQNKTIDDVRAIPKGELNSHIRKIPLAELLDHQNESDLHRLNKRWRFPSPSTFNFDNDADSRHVAIFGMQGAGVSTILRQILIHFESEEADKVEIGRADTSKNQAQRRFEDLMSSGENVFEIADKTFLWQFPGLGSKGAERGVNGEAYIRKYHIVWFHMVILVIKERCCFEPDIEIIRTCHKWGTRLQIVRTKFDVDLRSFVHDRPEKFEELKSRGKFNLKVVAECLREDMAKELTENLTKQGMEKEVVSKYVRQMYFVDGRDANLFVPYFRNLLKVLRFFCDHISIDQCREKLEQQICHNNDSQSFFISLVKSHGEEFAEIAERLQGTATDLNVFIVLFFNQILFFHKC